MTIKYKCEECGVSMKIKDELAGRNGKCPKCKNAFVIPQPEDEVPVDEVPIPDEPEPEEDDEEEDWDDDEDDDDLLDMPLEVTSAPATDSAAPAAAPPAPKREPRDRGEASATKKATRMSSRPKKAKKKSGGFDPADFLMGDDDAPAPSRPAATASSPPRPTAPPPRGRVGGLDDDDDDQAGSARANSSMSEMFRDFVPAGGVKREASGVASTSAAADALARRAEEKRAKSMEEPDLEGPKEEGVNYIEAAKDLWSEFGLYIGGFIVVLIGIFLITTSIFSSGRDIPPLHTVRGYVSKEGVAIAGAEIFFNPADTSREAMASSNNGGHVITDEEGYYEVEYLPGEWGLPAGRYNVQVFKGGIPFAPVRTMVIEPKTKDYNFQY